MKEPDKKVYDDTYDTIDVEATPFFTDEQTVRLWGETVVGNVDAGATIKAEAADGELAPTVFVAPAKDEEATIEVTPGSSGALLSESGMLTIHDDGSASMTIPGASVKLVPRRTSVTSGGEYEIGEVLGKGGMGQVNAARQASLDRRVVVKTIRSEYAAKLDAQEKFITEALATGSLDHPNVVPIHDMGMSEDGALFYVMKEVRGKTWKERMPTLSEQDNIDILLAVCDAVACAHDKGILHRDIKPDNVMLGDYGEVLVMDWGLAAAIGADAKAARLTDANACAGTPAYMAPEMARGRAGEIGPWSDQYLLGGVLFHILSGISPHGGKNAQEGVRNAANNLIQKTDRDDEWMRVAMRAMSMVPNMRYSSVKEFQRALRNCRIHNESIVLENRGGEHLKAAEDGGEYDDFVSAINAFEQALLLWEKNPDVPAKLRTARLAFARCAFDKGDFDLALSQLKGDGEEEKALAARAREEKADVEARRRRIRLLWKVATGLVLAIVFILVVSSVLISRQAAAERLAKEDAQAQRNIAEQRRAEADEQRAIAEEQRMKAEDALLAEADARRAEAEANDLRLREQEAKLAAEERARQRAEEALRAREEIQRLGYLEDNSRWRFDAAEAVERQRADANAFGLPIEYTVAIPDAPLAMTVIPSGDYVMGSPPRDPARNNDEYLHEVELSRPIHMGITEVTREQWRAVMGIETLEDLGLELGNESLVNVMWRLRALPEGDKRLPATGVSYLDIVEKFLPRLNALVPPEAGTIYRLPTEAEWEWAARAGATGHFYTGDTTEALAECAWYDANSQGRAHPVGEKVPNGWGLHDMIGNVWEILVDSYDSLYYLRAPRTDPVNSDDAVVKVSRGGSYINSSRLCRMSYRGTYMHRENRYPHAGFRLVRAFDR